jgi:hypothetical protein
LYLPVFVSVSLPLTLYVCFWVPCVHMVLCVSVSLYVSMSLCPYVYVCLCLPLPFCSCLSLSLSLVTCSSVSEAALSQAPKASARRFMTDLAADSRPHHTPGRSLSETSERLRKGTMQLNGTGYSEQEILLSVCSLSYLH